MSTEEQVKGYSLSAQENELRKYADYNFRDQRYEVITDEGYSATSLDRPGMKKVIEMIELDKVDNIIVKSVDRLTRNLEDMVNIKKLLMKHEIDQIITMHVRYDLYSARGTRMLFEDVVDSQHESDRTSERSRYGLREKARQGKYPYASKPYGFIKDEDHYLHWDNEQVVIIRDMFDYYVNQEMSEAETAKYIKEKHGLVLSRKNIRKFLSKGIYQGYTEASKEKFYIVDPIFSEQDIKRFDKRHTKKGYSKHDYKYRNKVYINGERAKQTTILRPNDRRYKYYYVPHCRYIEEAEIDQAVKLHSIKLHEEYNEDYEQRVVQIVKSYVRGEFGNQEMIEKSEHLKKKVFAQSNYIEKIEITVTKSGRVEIQIFSV